MTVLCLHYSRARKKNNSSEQPDGNEDSMYFVSSLVLTMESLKCVITLCFLTAQLGCSVSKTAQVIHREVIRRPADTFQLAVPAFLYIVQDNLIIYALAVLDAATYQVIILLIWLGYIEGLSTQKSFSTHKKIYAKNPKK